MTYDQLFNENKPLCIYYEISFLDNVEQIYYTNILSKLKFLKNRFSENYYINFFIYDYSQHLNFFQMVFNRLLYTMSPIDNVWINLLKHKIKQYIESTSFTMPNFNKLYVQQLSVHQKIKTFTNSKCKCIINFGSDVKIYIEPKLKIENKLKFFNNEYILKTGSMLLINKNVKNYEICINNPRVSHGCILTFY